MVRTREEIDTEIEAAKNELLNVKGTKCEVYQRIVGYMRNVNNWNKGKAEEYAERKTFVMPVYNPSYIEASK